MIGHRYPPACAVAARSRLLGRRGRAGRQPARRLAAPRPPSAPRPRRALGRPSPGSLAQDRPLRGADARPGPARAPDDGPVGRDGRLGRHRPAGPRGRTGRWSPTPVGAASPVAPSIGILSTSTLDHFDDPADLRSALAELARLLAPGGRLVLTLDNRRNPLIRARNALPRSVARRTGLVPFAVGHTVDAREGKALLADVGLRLLACEHLLHAPHVIGTRPARWRWYEERALLRIDGLARTRLASGDRPLRRVPGGAALTPPVRPPWPGPSQDAGRWPGPPGRAGCSPAG